MINLDFTPHLVEPLEYCCLNDTNAECTLMFAERLGKTMIAFCSWMYRLEFNPDSVRVGTIIYKSDEFARLINETKFEPILESIPKFRKELQRAFAKRVDHYNIAGAKTYFQGAGTDIIGLDIPWRYADEIDFWQETQGKVGNLKNLGKRGFTFDYGIFIKSSSPTVSKSPIDKDFRISSQGYWHLKCLGCGEHTMRSSDIHNLQWEYENEQIVEDSILLYCPVCKFAHSENMKRDMALDGKYIHRFPGRYDKHAGFQVGTVGSQMPKHKWLNIADVQDQAGKRANIENQKYLDNTFRGLPFKARKATAGQIETITSHCWDETCEPDPEKIENVFMSVDTQDDCFYVIVRSFDSNENTHLLAYDKVKTFDDVDEMWNKKYLGIEPIMAIQDEGGHIGKDVQAFVKDRAGFYSYKGNSKIGVRWKRNPDNKKLILANPKQFGGDLLYYIYTQNKRDNNYLFFPPDLSDVYIEQISSWKEDKNVKDGDQYENWKPTGPDHYFDCEKMMLVLIEFARKTLTDKQWRKGEGSWIDKTPTVVINNTQNGKNWGNGWR